MHGQRPGEEKAYPMTSPRATRGVPVWFTASSALFLAVLVHPGSASLAQAVEVEDPGESPKKLAEVARPVPPQGRIYAWKDGDRTRRAFLQSDLVVVQQGAIVSSSPSLARTGKGVVVRATDATEVQGQPVFRSPSGALMTLPGGVLLVLDDAWDQTEVGAFFAGNGIEMTRVSPLGEIPNGFVVATAPGFASLEFANELAGRDGVELSSPNWWREHTTR